MGWSAETFMVASLGTGHWSLSGQSIRAALEALAADGHDVGYLNLGAGPIDTATLSPRLAVHAPGPLPLADLARLVAAADLFLAPFSDGASTRRGSLMAALQHGVPVVTTAALQHGVPVVTTAGSSTGPALAGAAGLVFAADGSAAAFVEAVRRATADAGERAQAGRAARALYEQRFDWDVTAARLERELR
jgi:glycosyltransferase involved in cell wall biosynthesis